MTFAASYSQLSKWIQCPDRWLREPKQPPTPAMQFGDDTHRLRAAILTGQAVDSIEIKSGRNADALALAKAGTLPAADDLLSVEGSGIPVRLRVQMYGKTMGQVEITPGYKLTWVEDAVVLGEDGNTIVVLDWKTGRPDEDAHVIQGACYALAGMRAYPGFSRYVFRPVYLGFPDADYSLEYTPEDAGQLTDYLLGLMTQMEAAKKAGNAAPAVNKYCPSCALKTECPAFNGAVTVAPKADAYPMETPTQIVRAREQLSSIRKCVEAMEELADQKLKSLCGAGPVIIGAQEWYLKETPTRYEYDAEGVESALVAHEIDPLPFFRPDRAELKKLEKTAPAAFAAVQAHERVKGTCSKLYSRTARGIIEVPPSSSYEDGGPLARRGEIRETVDSVSAESAPAADQVPPFLPPAAAAPPPVEDIAGTPQPPPSSGVAETDERAVEPGGGDTSSRRSSGGAEPGKPSDREGADSGSPGVLEQHDAAPTTGARPSFAVGDRVRYRNQHRIRGTVVFVSAGGYRTIAIPSLKASHVAHVYDLEADSAEPVQPPPGVIPFTHPLEAEPSEPSVQASSQGESVPPPAHPCPYEPEDSEFGFVSAAELAPSEVGPCTCGTHVHPSHSTPADAGFCAGCAAQKGPHVHRDGVIDVKPLDFADQLDAAAERENERAEKPKRKRRACRVDGCEATHRHSHKEGVFITAGFVAVKPELGSLGPWKKLAETEEVRE